MEFKLLLCLCLSAIGIGISLYLEEKCYIFPKNFIPDGESEDYIADIGCRNGTIEWHYPHSFIRVHFRRTLPTFKVCFTDGLVGQQFNLTDVTNGLRHRLPNVDTALDYPVPVCINSSHGEAILQINATSPQTYMGSIKYRIV